MITGWPIRRKLTFCIALLLIAVTILSINGIRGVYAFRGLARSVSRRATELPLAVALAQHVSAMRATLPTSRRLEMLTTDSGPQPIGGPLLSLEFDGYLRNVRETLQCYRQKLHENASVHVPIGDIRRELDTARQMEATLQRIGRLKSNEDWLLLDDVQQQELTEAVDELIQLAEKLPSYLQERMHDLQGDVRWHYRTWIVLAWLTSLFSALLLLLLGQLFYRWVFRPLRTLIEGSRRVAAGDFLHRIQLSSGDEMDELAQAMNDMTERFQQIRDDLDRQVQQRTREVIRGEQLASVGFLAAGVAHEINNPLASIALCAESLEERLVEVLCPADSGDATSAADGPEVEVVRDYLRMMQEEAFRCKEITERLLDFSRLGDVQQQETDLAELVQGVIEMVGHVGKYRQKQIEFHCGGPVRAWVNSQEMKQVVLNLITNGLESLDPGGTVTVQLRRQSDYAELIVTDNGCGMSEEVKAHLFEPFFTRRKDGQGTGLGMSITFRIIAEHGGEIDVYSAGPGHGSRLTVRLPLKPRHMKEHRHRHQAA